MNLLTTIHIFFLEGRIKHKAISLKLTRKRKLNTWVAGVHGCHLSPLSDWLRGIGRA